VSILDIVGIDMLESKCSVAISSMSSRSSNKGLGSRHQDHGPENAILTIPQAYGGSGSPPTIPLNATLQFFTRVAYGDS